MSERNPRNEAIVRQLEADANAAAEIYLEDVEEFQRLYRLERMQDIVEDLAEWIEETGDLNLLNDLGVQVIEEDEIGVLMFVQGKRSMIVRPRDDMNIVVDGRIMQPNKDCPVLDQPFYAEVMSRVFGWAGPDNEAVPRRYFG